MTANYYVKAYFNKPGQEQPEIRRFAIDISSGSNAYEDLRTKLASFQTDERLKEFTLQYTDEDNERITFSSNEELHAAIASNKDVNTLKVFVNFVQSVPRQEQQAPQDRANKECHVGVVCDGCQGPVIGFRYKCFVCPNYDLCEKCSAAGVHSEHNMIKITRPGNLQHPHPHHFHPHPHHHGRPHRPGHPWRMPPPMPSFPAGREFIENVQAQIPQWLPNRPNPAHIRAHVQQHLDSLKANTQNHVQNSKQYLESVGQYLQQALSPYGIDCDYHVDDKAPATAEQTEQEQPPATQQEEQSATADAGPVHEPDAVPKYPDLEEQPTSATSASSEEPTTIRDPRETAVDECMDKMQAMGFTDASGGLRELVRSKQGDLNAVLDAINPRHFQE